MSVYILDWAAIVNACQQLNQFLSRFSIYVIGKTENRNSSSFQELHRGVWNIN